MESQEHAKTDDTISIDSDAKKEGPAPSKSLAQCKTMSTGDMSLLTPPLSKMPPSSTCGCCSPFFAMLPLQKRIVILTGFYITFFAGAVHGWGPMQLMLEGDGAFSYRCTSEEVASDVICQQQTISLLRIPLIAGLCSILSPILGHVADKYGSYVLVVVMSLFCIFGISLIMVASGTGVDWIHFAAFSFLYLMLMSGSIMITKTGLLFDNGDARRRVISVLNALLDAGTMTYLILLKILQGIEGATFLGVMGGYLGFAALCFGLVSHQWIRMCRQLEKEGDAIGDTNKGADEVTDAPAAASERKERSSRIQEVKKARVSSGTRFLLARLFSSLPPETASAIPEEQEANREPDAVIGEIKGTVLNEESNHADRDEEELDEEFFNEATLEGENVPQCPSVRHTSLLSEKSEALSLNENEEDNIEFFIDASFGGKYVHNGGRSSVKRTSLLSHELEEVLLNENECFCQVDPNSKHKLIRSRSAKEQLRSELYLLTLGYYILHCQRCVFTLATARDFLGYLGDDLHDNKYLSIFTFLNTASIIGQPAIDFILKNYGYGAGLQAVNVLGLAHGIILVASPNLDVQIVGFVVFSFYRGFLFSVVFSFVASYLGATVIGKGVGLMNSISSMILLVNLPLADWAVTKLDGNFFWPNFIYMIGMLPCLAMAWRMERISRQDNVAEKYVCLNCRVKQDTVELKINRRVSLNRRPSALSIAASLEPSDRRLSHRSAEQHRSLLDLTMNISGINDSRVDLSHRRSSIISLTVEGLDSVECNK